MSCPSALTARLRACYSGIVQDVLRARGLGGQCLPPGIVGLQASMKMAGPIFTVTGEAGQGISEHESLMSWTGFLALAPQGHVVVCQPNDDQVAHMGELSAETLSRKGVSGYLVDGGCRDTEFIRNLGFPVFCRYRTPVDIVGRWRVGATGEAVKIGEVEIHPGDYLLADCDGAVVIPQAMAQDTVDAAFDLMNTESAMRRAIREGADPQEAYLKYGKF